MAPGKPRDARKELKNYRSNGACLSQGRTLSAEVTAVGFPRQPR
jgi:hypothetical protein